MLTVSLIITVLVIIIILASAGTLFYVIKQQTVAIIERFGKYQTTSSAGFHVKLPWELIVLRHGFNCVFCKTK